MPEDLREALKELYPWDKPPEYFAGGHAWSDGTIYSYSRQGEERLLKVMPAGSERSLASVAERQAWQEWLSQNSVDTLPPLHSEAGRLAEAVTCGTQEYIVHAWRMVSGKQVQLGDPRDCSDFYRRWGGDAGKNTPSGQKLAPVATFRLHRRQRQPSYQPAARVGGFPPPVSRR